ncbi:MAG: hypothetical protein AB7G28_00730 [Pirellulales bacterium]
MTRFRRQLWACVVSVAGSLEWLLSASGAAAGLVPDGSRVFMSISGNENICGAADENHNSFCAVAAGPAVPVNIPPTTFADPRGTNFGFITAGASVTSGKTATGTAIANSGEFEFISINDTYTVHGATTGPFPITVTLHVTGSFGTRETGPPFGNVLSFEATQLEIGTFHPEATLTQFVVNAFPPDAQNPTTAQVSQSHSAVVSATPVTIPLDVQVSYTKMVEVDDVFDIAYGIDLNLSGNGQINMNPPMDAISFALPEGVFLTSALGATFGTATGVVGDYNRNQVVDAADYTLWRDTFGQNVAMGSGADGDNNGTVEAADFDVWRMHFDEHSGSGAEIPVQAPEPATLTLLIVEIGTPCCRRRILTP